MTKILVFIAAIYALNSFAYMQHNQIVRQLRSEEQAKSNKKGVVFFKPAKEVFKKHKKKKRGKNHDQKFSFKRATPTPIPPQDPTEPVTPEPTPRAGGEIPSGSGGVDLREKDSPVKSQVGGTCTAYSLAACLENKIGDRKSLSAAHVWSFYKKYSGEVAARVVPGNKITTWDMWPDMSSPHSGYEKQAQHKITKINYIDQEYIEDQIEHAKRGLDHGNPIYTALQVPADMASCFSTIRPSTSITSGGHMVAIVGYRDDPTVKGGGYFIIKNSWGADCGDEGYQYMAYSVCSNRGMYCDFYELAAIE